jgi:hypothetical protein
MTQSSFGALDCFATLATTNWVNPISSHSKRLQCWICFASLPLMPTPSDYLLLHAAAGGAFKVKRLNALTFTLRRQRRDPPAPSYAIAHTLLTAWAEGA